MQAVILAAGKGTRIGVLTSMVPKPLLPIDDRRLLDYKLESLPESVNEIIIVIGYLGHMIEEYIGKEYRGVPVRYVVQHNTTGGTMDALLQARPILKGTFLVTNADDIHKREDVAACVRSPWSLAVMQLEELDSSSRVDTDESGRVKAIVEANVHKGGPGLGGVGLYVTDERIFSIPPVQLEGRTELGLPQTMLKASQTHHIPIHAVEMSFRVHVTTSDDLTRAQKTLGKI